MRFKLIMIIVVVVVVVVVKRVVVEIVEADLYIAASISPW